MAAFKVFDLDGDGFITRDELKVAMEMIGEDITEEQLTQVIIMADTDHDGKINYEGMFIIPLLSTIFWEYINMPQVIHTDKYVYKKYLNQHIKIAD